MVYPGSINLEAAILGSYSGLSNLVYRVPGSTTQITTPMRTTVLVWRQVSRLLAEPQTFFPYTPLWGNPLMSHLGTVPDPQLWPRYGVRTLRDIMPEGRLLSFGELKGRFVLPPWMYFRFLQLRHGIRAQFPGPITVEPHSVERFLTTRIIDRMLSSTSDSPARVTLGLRRHSWLGSVTYRP